MATAYKTTKNMVSFEHQSLAIASISRASPSLPHLRKNPLSIHSSPSTLHFPSYTTPRFRALKTASDGGRVGSHDAYGRDLLRKPLLSPPDDDDDDDAEGSNWEGETEREYEKKEGGESQWVDWEDQILEATVPLVGFVRMILHSQN